MWGYSEDMTQVEDSIIACSDCDLLHRMGRIPDGHAARCTRCGSVLLRPRRNSIDRSLAFTVAALFLFALANAFPLMTFEIEGRSQDNLIISGVIDLFNAGMWELAGLVLLTSVLAPLAYLLLLLCLLVPTRFNRHPPWLARCFRLFQQARSWAILEVYMLGILVAYVKLSDFGTVIAGPGLYAFGLLIATLVAIRLTFDAHAIWADSDGV